MIHSIPNENTINENVERVNLPNTRPESKQNNYRRHQKTTLNLLDQDHEFAVKMERISRTGKENMRESCKSHQYYNTSKTTNYLKQAKQQQRAPTRSYGSIGKTYHKLIQRNQKEPHPSTILQRDLSHDVQKPLWIVSTKQKPSGSHLDKTETIARGAHESYRNVMLANRKGCEAMELVDYMNR